MIAPLDETIGWPDSGGMEPTFAKTCGRCHEPLFRSARGWIHRDGKSMHWQEIAIGVPGLAAMAFLVILALIFAGGLMNGMGAGH